jgi:hypothetical protein
VRLEPIQQPPWPDYVAADLLCSTPQLTVCRDDGDGLPVSGRLGGECGDCVVTAMSSVDDTQPVLFTFADAPPSCAFEHDDDWGLKPAGFDRVGQPSVQVLGSFPAVPPPPVRP